LPDGFQQTQMIKYREGGKHMSGIDRVPVRQTAQVYPLLLCAAFLKHGPLLFRPAWSEVPGRLAVAADGKTSEIAGFHHRHRLFLHLSIKIWLIRNFGR
jgi:hypothetical protein